MFSIFRSRHEVLTATQKKRLVKAIKEVEIYTSGEVRVYIEGQCPTESPMERCMELFEHLEMHKTILRNAVLIYLATNDKKYAIFGDEGIYTKISPDYWGQKASALLPHLRSGDYARGLEESIRDIGKTLATHFPPALSNKNELPDDILFGKF